MPRASATRVLVVEDQPANRGRLTMLLNQIGIEMVVETGSGRDALATLERAPVDLIISDRDTAEIDGMTLLRTIRGHPATAELPFIMTSNRGDPEDVKSAIGLGVTDYVVKPFSPAAMRRRIEAALGNAARLTER